MVLLRTSLFNLYFYLLTFVLGLAGIMVRIFARDRALDFARFWVRLVLAGLRCICGIRIAVQGAENLPRTGAALIASQHQSAFDTLVWLTLVPLPSYVMKQELTRIPLFGPLLRPAGMIAVDRSAGAGALRGLLRETEAAFQAGRQVVIFPEGTRVAPGERVKLHPGIVAIATHNRMPIIPVATDSGFHWGRHSFRKPSGVIHIVIGAPIPADTAKTDILGAIEARWRVCERWMAVDNSVE
jgi:1-acyl-sn-glycerol-3-phosphate acyltransferase